MRGPCGRQLPPAAGARQVAALEQIRLDDLLKRVGLFAHGGGDGVHARRSATERCGQHFEIPPVERVEAEPVDAFERERLFDDLGGDEAGIVDLRVVADAAQEAIDDARRAAAAPRRQRERLRRIALHLEEARRAARDGVEIIVAVELEVVRHAEAAAQRAGDQPGSRRRADEAEGLDVERDRARVHPRIDGDVDAEVFHRGIDVFLDGGGEAVDLIDKEDVAAAKLGERADEVAGAGERGAGGDVDLPAHLVADHVREGRLAQARRAVEKDVFERLATLLRRLDGDAKALHELRLADILIEASRAQRPVLPFFFGVQAFSADQSLARHAEHDTRAASRAPIIAPMPANPAKLVYLETFGCQMNELDSELVTSQLRALGYRFTPDAEAAGVILYNTCSVREQAEQKVWSRLGLMKARKKRQPDLLLGVLGCMAERDGSDMLRKFPHVDLLCGPGELDKLPLLLRNASTTAEPAVALQGNNSRRSATLAAAEDSLERLDLSRRFAPGDQQAGGRSAYVRITRGCNKFCTYCVVPFTRGAEMHRPPDTIVDECNRLVERGVVEITLLGQTVNHYRFEHDAAVTLHGIVQPQKGRSFTGGHDRDPLTGGRVTTFAGLLRRIHDEVPALKRLRFVTSYPRDFGNDVLEVIRDCPRICRYIHVPVQSGSNRVLEAMNRGYTVEEYRDLIERVRAALPGAMIASDVIVGFPGETEEDFDATVDLLRWARFKNCFVFKYSPRPGTPAFDRLPDDVPDEVKRRRNNALLAVQGEISQAIHAAHIGRTVSVFVEGFSTMQARREPLLAGAPPRPGGAIGLTLNGRALAGAEIGEEDCGSTCAAAGEFAPETDSDLVQLSGRTEGDLITVFNTTRSRAEALIGSIVPVRIEETRTLTLKGTLVAQGGAVQLAGGREGAGGFAGVRKVFGAAPSSCSESA